MPRTPTERAKALTDQMPALKRLARRLAPDSTQAEDLMQEALLRVWGRIESQPSKDVVDDMRPYLMTTLRNLSRRPARRFDALEETDMPVTPDTTPGRLATQEVLRAISTLPADQAAVLTRTCLEGSQYSELSQSLGVPVGTVMSRLSRARARLRKELDLPDGEVVGDLLDLGATH